jgi:hypothetical protein
MNGPRNICLLKAHSRLDARSGPRASSAGPRGEASSPERPLRDRIDGIEIGWAGLSRRAGSMGLYAGVEAGGSKFICEVAASPTSRPLDSLRVETTDPEETLGKVERFLVRHGPDAVGIASFGPLDLHKGSRTFGRITSTPKPGWHDADIANRLRRAVGVPVGFDFEILLLEHSSTTSISGPPGDRSGGRGRSPATGSGEGRAPAPSAVGIITGLM